MDKIIVAHRGISGHFPENTKLSIKKAIESGIQWVEIDVQPCKSGELVVIHDFTVDRCSNANGRVDSYTLDELKQLDFGGWFDPAFKGERILTLAELLVIAKEHNLSLNIEIKLDTKNAEPVAIELKKELDRIGNNHDTILLSSFSNEIVKAVAHYCPNYRLGAISDKLDNATMALLNEVRTYSCHLDYKHISQQDIDYLNQNKKKIWCFTVNCQSDFVYFDQVDAIFSDFPERFIESSIQLNN